MLDRKKKIKGKRNVKKERKKGEREM